MSGMFYNGKCDVSSLLSLTLCLSLLIAIVTSNSPTRRTEIYEVEIDKSQCHGPLRYYEEIKCKPEYLGADNVCPTSFDCSHLEGRENDKCYINGHVYDIREPLRKSDKTNPCEVGCMCSRGYGGVASFICATVDCFQRPIEPKPGCYIKKMRNSCCNYEEVCPNSAEERVECVVDGNTYFEGQEFYPQKNPEVSCTCLPGYEGENVAPFCKTSKCGIELRHGNELSNNCVPVFESGQKPQNSCNYQYRCQNKNDVVIRKTNPRHHAPESKMCKFGNLTMYVGDELKKATYWDSVCVKCTCEVPPLPTCQKLSDLECDFTNHPVFEEPDFE